MIQVITGSNTAAIKDYVDKKIKKFIDVYGDLSLEKASAEDLVYEQIFSSVESVPFLSARKMFILNNLSLQKNITEDLDRFLSRVNEAVDLLIVENKPDKRSAYYKKIKKLDNFIEFDNLDQSALADLLIKKAKASSADLNFSDAIYLIDRVGQNQLLLEKELQKLLAYNSKITRENIELLTEQNPQSSIFNLLDAVFSGRTSQALRLYDEQRTQGVEPTNILGMLAWQLHIVALVSSANGKSSDEIANITKLKPFVIQKSRVVSDKIGPKKLQDLIEELTEIDLKFKTTAINQDMALKNFIAISGN